MNKRLWRRFFLRVRIALPFILLGLFAIVPRSLFAQVNITVIVTPPYSPYLADYISHNKLLVSVQNLSGTQHKIKLVGSITSDNGVEITTNPGYQPPTPIVLNPGENKTLYSNDISKYIDPGNVTLKGISKQALIMGQTLPEGNYQFCFQAVDYQTGASLSSPAPAGCSAQINLQYYDPPVFTKPACGEPITSPAGSILTFSWMDNKPAIANWQYHWHLKEVPPGVNPNAVMSNESYPLLAQSTAGYFVMYTGQSLQLIAGKTYAMQVQAEDVKQKDKIKNNGFSEVCSFKYQPTAPPDTSTKPTQLVLLKPTSGEHYGPDTLQNANANLFFSWSPPYPSNIDEKQFYYGIKIVKVKPGETPEVAIQKEPAFLDLGYGNKNWRGWNETYTNLGGNGLEPLSTYAWQVQAWSAGKIIITSETRTFIIDKLLHPAGHGDSLRTKPWLIKTVELGGYPIHINVVTTPDLNNFGGVGYVYLQKGAEAREIHFDALQIGVYDQVQPDGAEAYTINGTVDQQSSYIEEYPEAVLTRKIYFTGGPTKNKSLLQGGSSNNKLLSKTSMPNNKALIPGSSLNAKAVQDANNKIKGMEEANTAAENENVGMFRLDYQRFKLSSSTVVTKSGRQGITSTEALVYGRIRWYFPLIFTGSNTLKSTQSNSIDMADDWYKVDYENGITAPKPVTSPSGIGVPLVSPANFVWRMDKLTFFLSNSAIDFQMSGALTLPNLKTGSGNSGAAPELAFQDLSAFHFTGSNDTKNGMAFYPVTYSSIAVHPANFVVDLRPYIVSTAHFQKSKYMVISLTKKPPPVLFSGGVLDFPSGSLDAYSESDGGNWAASLTNASQVPFTQASVNSDGLDMTFTTDGMNWPATFNNFPSSITHLEFTLASGVVYGSIGGSVHIPFLGEDIGFHIPMQADGFGSTYTDDAALGNRVIFGKSSSEAFELDFNVGKFTFGTGAVSLDGDFSFIDKNNSGYQIPTVSVTGFIINPDGSITLSNADQTGYISLPYTYNGSFNGYPFGITNFGFEQQNGYNVKYNGSITLADNLSAPGGSVFESKFNFTSAANGDGTWANTYVANTNTGVHVVFASQVTQFEDDVSFAQDPDYGFQFTKDLSYPLSIFGGDGGTISGKIIIGRTGSGDGSFSYWFLEAGVQGAFEIPVGVFDVVIDGFTGRMYYHMSHTVSGGITAENYAPDANASFGVFCDVQLKTSADDGVRFYGDAALEILMNSNGGLASATFAVNANLLSTGVNKGDAMVTGIGVITYNNVGSAYFDASFAAHADLKSSFCADATLEFHADGSGWFLNLGTPQSPITAIPFCSIGGYNGFIDVSNSNLHLGAGYKFDTGDQTWACFYGHAWGSIGIDANMQYSPFQFSGTAHLDAEASAGFHALGHSLEVISGAVSADLIVELPHPTCFAGKVSGKGCIRIIAKICKTVTLKIQYKDGAFALKGDCN